MDRSNTDLDSLCEDLLCGGSTLWLERGPEWTDFLSLIRRLVRGAVLTF